MRFNYNPEISLGSILQVLTIILGVGAGYGALVQANIVQDQLLVTHEKEIAQIRQLTREAASELKADVKDIQKDIKKLDEKFTDYAIKNAVPNPRR